MEEEEDEEGDMEEMFRNHLGSDRSARGRPDGRGAVGRTAEAPSAARLEPWRRR